MLRAQLCQSIDTSDLAPFITNDEWCIQQKLDGHRIMLHFDGPYKPTAITRNGTPYTRKLSPEILAVRLPEGQWVIDGELMPDGTFWAFDLPQCPIAGIPPAAAWTSVPLQSRYNALATLLQNHPTPFKLAPMACTREQKVALSSRALSQGLEGLVLKKRQSPYTSGGRNTDWLKLKFVSTADVVVKRLRADGKESVEYVVFDDDGNEVEIGKASLIGKEKRGALAVGDVIEVRYLYVGADNRLYQPTIVGKRTDKSPHECTTGQLRHVNKEVLATL